MKKTAIFSTLIIICIVVFTACSKSSTSATAGGGTGGGGTKTFTCNSIAPKFSTDVQPILTTLCSINSNCHASGSINSGGPLTTFAEVSAKKSNIRAQILAGIMPQSGTITQDQINAFICWIDAGGANN